MILSDISNKKLLKLSKLWGAQALAARNNFLGILPEINRRKLYGPRFVSIFHYAAVTAGVQRELVSRVLHLEDLFQNMPTLLHLLVNGIVSVNKLCRIVSIVTVENEKELANLVQTLSKSALQVWVRDILIKRAREKETQSARNLAVVRESESQIQDGLFEAQNSTIPVAGHGFDDFTTTTQSTQIAFVKNPELSDEVKIKLNELQEKQIDVNVIILDALKKREEEIAGEDERLAQRAQEKAQQNILASRNYIDVATRRHLGNKHGTKCAIETCNKPSVNIHHTARFSISRSHNPHFLAPLCKEHHQMAHSIDVQATEIRTRRMH